jgi:transaldolase
MRIRRREDYEAFAREILEVIKDRPYRSILRTSFARWSAGSQDCGVGRECFRQVPARIRRTVIHGTGQTLAHSGQGERYCRFDFDRVRSAAAALAGGAPSLVSVFAGDADTGRDPIPVMTEAAEIVSAHSNIELIWASPRELLNIFQANGAGCHIITVPDNILAKLQVVGKDLQDYSLETVLMFHNDAAKSGYQL